MELFQNVKVPRPPKPPKEPKPPKGLKALKKKLAKTKTGTKKKKKKADKKPQKKKKAKKKSTKKLTLVRQVLTHSQLVARVEKELPDYIMHDFRRRWQAAHADELLTSLPLHWLLLNVDFSMNCLSPVQREAQSLFFNTRAASLLSVIAYFRDPDTLKIRKLIYPVFSDVLSHSADFVEAAMDKVADDLAEHRDAPNFTHEFRLSDACAGQFRCKRSFALARHRAVSRGITCLKMFNEAGHGKGLVDGATVPVKRAIRRDGLTRDPNHDSVATSALGMAAACAALINKLWSQRQQAKCPAHAARVVFEQRVALVVTAADIDAYADVEVDYEKIAAPGTMQTHSMVFRPDGAMLKSKLSCCCPSCLEVADAPQCPNVPWVGAWLDLAAEYGGNPTKKTRQLRAPLTGGEELLEEMVSGLSAGSLIAVPAPQSKPGKRARAGESALYALLELDQAPAVPSGPGQPPHVFGAPAASGALLVHGRMRVVLPKHVQHAADPADRAVLLPEPQGKPEYRYATSVAFVGVEVTSRRAAPVGPQPRRTRDTTARTNRVVSFEQHQCILDALPLGDADAAQAEQAEQAAGTSQD